MPVYGYCRVSTQYQADTSDSLEVQRRQIEGYVIMHGLDLKDVYVDPGVSGSIPVTNRPSGSALFSILARGDIVIAAKLDRLFRSALDALQTVDDLKKRGVSLHLLDLGGDISGNGLSKLFLTIAAAFAEAERDRIKERAPRARRGGAGRDRRDVPAARGRRHAACDGRRHDGTRLPAHPPGRRQDSQGGRRLARGILD